MTGNPEKIRSILLLLIAFFATGTTGQEVTVLPSAPVGGEAGPTAQESLPEPREQVRDLPDEAASFSCVEQGEQQAAFHDRPTLSVVSLNLAHGRGDSLHQLLVPGREIRGNLTAIADMLAIQNVDVVALQEADSDSAWSGGFNHLDWLFGLGGYACSLHGIHAQSPMFRFGTALLSRVYLQRPLSVAFEPSPPSTTKGLVSASLRWVYGGQDRSIRLISAHFDFSRGSVRRAQTMQLLQAVQASEEPVIVMGDFNAEWDGDESVVAMMVAQGGLVAWQPGSGEWATYKDKRLDWILLTRQLEFVDYRVLPDLPSDHRAVFAEIRLLPEGEQ